MKPVIQWITREIVKVKFLRKNIKPSKPQVADLEKNVTVEFKHILQDVFLMVMGALSASFGLIGFLLPNAFIDGGVTGISLIVSELSGISLSVFIIIFNLPFIIMGYSTIGKQFAIKSILAIILLSLFVYFIPYPVVTQDKLLVAVFGGFFLGLGIGLAVRGGSVIDGTEVLAIFISRKTAMTIGDVILMFNVLIFFVAAYVFTVEISLYAMLTYLAASKTVDFVVSGIEEYLGVTIISDKSEEIRLAIIEKLGRGCTIYDGKKGFGKRGENLKKTDIIYTLLTRLEISRLKTEIDKIDREAFIVMHSIKDVKGGMIKKRSIPG
ncbi:MAG: YitT family protein [Cyclobacteriaceae bacterium]|nr:YitT family protein [Cyclobacteriaceae bacterium]